MKNKNKQNSVYCFIQKLIKILINYQLIFYTTLKMNFLLFSLIAFKFIFAYEILTQSMQLKNYIERSSYKPTLISYQVTNDIANLHQDFIQIENIIKDYANIVVLDCAKNLQSNENKYKITECKNIVQKKIPNSLVYGVRPQDFMINIRGQLIEIRPEFVQFRDQKTINDLVDFAQSLVPNYLKKLYTENDFSDFLNNGNHLLPKIILCTESEQEQFFIRKLSIFFYGRVQFAQLVVSQPQDIRQKIGIFKYNFQTFKFEKKYLEQKLNDKQYENVKKIIESYALDKPIRQSYFRLGFPIYQPINYANSSNFTKVKYDSQVWTLVYEGSKDRGKQILSKYREKYSHYLKYVLLQSKGAEKLYLSHEQNKLLPLESVSLEYDSIVDFQEIRQKFEQLLYYQSIILLVEPKLDYLCSVQNLKLFKNTLFCFVLKQQNIDEMRQVFEISQSQNLALLTKLSRDNQLKGDNFKNATFQIVVRQIYSSINQKITFLTSEFLKNPVIPVVVNQSYSRMCAEKCLIYLYDTQNPNTKQRKLLTNLALKYNEWLRFIEGDYRCNSDLYSLIKKDTKNAALILYQKGKYYHLKQKISEKNIQKLYRTYRREKLKFKQFPSDLRSNQMCQYQVNKSTDKNQTKVEKKQVVESDQL